MFTRGSCAFFLFRHLAVEFITVYFDGLLITDLFGKFKRKSISIIQLKSYLSRQDPLFFSHELLDLPIKKIGPLFKCTIKLFFLEAYDMLYCGPLINDLGIWITH